jgi:LacI family transcriptional regulator
VSATGSVHEAGNMSLSKPITIKQVAEIAGVSIQTVSRVINNRYDVSEETRLKVLATIEKLGYQPNAIARGLASRRSRTLGLVTFDFTDYFFTCVVTGAEAEAHRHGYFFILGNSRCDPSEEPTYLRLLTERHVEGVLFAREGTPNDLHHLQSLHQSGVPVVVTGFYDPNANLNLVDVNNFAGGYRATRYLIETGHQKIALITGPVSNQAAQDRRRGYLQALAEAGLAYNPQLEAEGNYLHQSGYDAMVQILQRGQPFSAVFASNDRMAIGAIYALHQAGLHVPGDISVVGFDDVPEAEFSIPPLTTIRQPMIRVGEEAVKLLIERIENPGLPPRLIQLDIELVKRQSVAPPRSFERR